MVGETSISTRQGSVNRFGAWLRVYALLVVCFLFPAILISASHAGQERFDYDELGRLVRTIDEQGRITTYTYDPAGNLLSVVASGAASTAPVVTSVSPDFVRIGETRTIRITGEALAGVRVSTGDPLVTPTVIAASADELAVSVAVAVGAALGPKTLTLSNSVGSSTTQITIRPTLVLSTIPSHLEIPPDSTGRIVTVRISPIRIRSRSF